MFDEKNEPEDILAEVDPVKPVAPPPPASEPVTSRGPSRLLFVVIALVVIGALGGGAYFMFFRGEAEQVPEEAPAAEAGPEHSGEEPEDLCGNDICDPGEDNFSCPGDCEIEGPVCGDGLCLQDEDFDNCPEDCPSPTPIEPVTDPDPLSQPTDADGDGLTDEEEMDLGTNPESEDTDSDGLTDMEEIRNYGTDPKNPDTDGDGFLDGQEVEGGYNPNGPGMLPAPPL
ncbi:MAG: hypothetical protein U9Q03_01840 [Patescibacteria group bacterium]|nr:hypothetical protein [Patescibacteria group bacterium]